MACILPFNGKTPRIRKGAFIAPTAALIGDVEIGDGASVWFGAVLRGDEAAIRIGAHTSVQDNVVIHVYEGHDTVIEDHVTIGHGAILEACHVGSYALIGMNAVVLDRAKVGARALIAAGSVVLEDQEIPPDTLAAGAPAKVKKKIEGSASKWLEISSDAYQRLTRDYRAQGVGIVDEELVEG
ncbi:MAG: gamma carbonic anhydrase family protein [Candidatus Eremiobacteraeota bacterium]|nr:gamma carbonic anhydrase family protein [Candidatus Eremiobacteraeota bacterium]MBV8366835.1 gamma carbonic anhydrase family protein [Candidatus Eremiobacteraeota bacterium]